MSYENRFNELILNVVNKNGDPLFKFEMSINFTDADGMSVPEVDVRFITKPTNEFEDELQDELVTFAEHAKNREKFLTEDELTVVFNPHPKEMTWVSSNAIYFPDDDSRKEEKQIDEYFENGGNCPFCKSPGIEGLEVEFEGAQCIRNVHCNTCQKSWTDVYKLVSMQNL